MNDDQEEQEDVFDFYLQRDKLCDWQKESEESRGHATRGSRSTSPRHVPQSENREPSRATGNRARAAKPQRPVLSVHALGQFEFCPRAGIYAAEHPEPQDADEPLPSLGYLPNFDLEQIEERLQEELTRLVWWTIAELMIFWGLWVAFDAQRRIVWYALLIGFCCCAGSLVSSATLLVRLLYRRTAARNARDFQPEICVVAVTAVNWWAILKSGFEPMVFDRPLQHPTLPLDGNPWRVLVQGSLRIPVIRSGSRRLGPRPGEVFRKHRLRLAAYAELLEATQHVQTPFGLVFPADSHLGLAVPLPASERVNLSQRFERAVRWLRDSQSAHSDPRLPEDRNRCSGCELGYPRPIARKEIEEARRAHRPLLVLENADQKTYHCHCGDRFGGLPPHRKTLEMRLRATPD